jgi:V8-like Glu-specific endopeptidase
LTKIKKIVFAVLSGALAIVVFRVARAHVGTGDVDGRMYVNWHEYPYNLFVRIEAVYVGSCTGQYVGPDLILTARHCTNYGVSNSTTRRLVSSVAGRGPGFHATALSVKGNLRLRLIYVGANEDEEDWALFRIVNPSGFSDKWFKVSSTAMAGLVISAGYGSLRILSKDWEEIPAIRQKYSEYLKEQRNNVVLSRFKDNDIELMDTYTIIRPDTVRDSFDEWLGKENNNLVGDRKILPLFNDDKTLKAHLNCEVYRIDNYVRHLCQSWSGDSGGALINGDSIWGIKVQSQPSIGVGYPERTETPRNIANYSSNAVRPEHFYEDVRRALENSLKRN